MPWIFALTHEQHHRRFSQQSVLEITRTILAQYPHRTDDFSRLDCDYPPIPYVEQHNETDLAFLQRLWAENGIYYIFKHTNNNHVLLLLDAFHQYIQDRTLIFRQNVGQEGSIDNLSLLHYLVVPEHTVADYDYENVSQIQETIRLSQNTDHEPPALTQKHYPGRVSTDISARQLAKKYVQQHRSHEKCIQGSGVDLRLFPAYLAKLANHPYISNASDYLIKEVYHRGYDYTHVIQNNSQAIPEQSVGAAGGQYYQNNFTLLANIIPMLPEVESPFLRLPGHQHARLQGKQIGDVAISQLAKMAVQTPTEETDIVNYTLRTLQPWAGLGHGMQFQPCVGDAAIMKPLYHRPERGVILGHVYHQQCKPRHQFTLEQTKNSLNTKVIHTGKDAQHELLFDDNETQSSVTLESSQDMHIHAVGSALIEANGINREIQASVTQEANEIIMQAKGTITLETSQAAIVLQKNSIHIQAMNIMILN
jgi:type VI secretion system secreted protein VgrG